MCISKKPRCAGYNYWWYYYEKSICAAARRAKKKKTSAAARRAKKNQPALRLGEQKNGLRCGSASRAAARQFLFTCLRNEKINTVLKLESESSTFRWSENIVCGVSKIDIFKTQRCYESSSRIFRPSASVLWMFSAFVRANSLSRLISDANFAILASCRPYY